MCGRYALYGPTSRLHRQFVIPDDVDQLPRDRIGAGDADQLAVTKASSRKNWWHEPVTPSKAP